MKKLVLMLAVVFSMSFFACGNKEAAADAVEATADTVAVVADAAVAEVVDTLTNDTTVVVEEAVEAAPVEEAK